MARDCKINQFIDDSLRIIQVVSSWTGLLVQLSPESNQRSIAVVVVIDQGNQKRGQAAMQIVLTRIEQRHGRMDSGRYTAGGRKGMGKADGLWDRRTIKLN